MEIVESVAPHQQKRGRQVPGVNIDYAVPGCAWAVGVPALIILAVLVSVSDWAKQTFLAGLWPFLIGFFALIAVPCVVVVGWHFYKVHKLYEHEQKKRKSEQRLLSEQVNLTRQANLLVQESRANGDNVKLQFGDNGGLKSIEVIRAAALAAQSVRQGSTKVVEQKPLQQIAQQAGGVTGYTPAAGTENDEEEPVTLPVAPRFADMCHLITTEKMPLCFVIDPRNKGRVIPMFGTIDDLLSMAVTGKPGRGKTVALMYYVAMLLRSGAEVYVFDPHGAMAELSILNDRVLPGMPATARVHYYDRKESITAAVPGLYRELEERDNYYRPQWVNDELLSHRVKHPLLVLADELPILADFDEQVEAEYKKINRQLLKDGKEELEVPSLIYLIRRIVLEARKWRCFFIGSGQSMDAEVLPTKVTENLNSRIVFFSSNRRARMSGLENDAIKTLLPLIRRGGSGVMIYDCARWEEPLIGAIPYITVQDLLDFLGVDRSAVAASFGADLGTLETGSMRAVVGNSEAPKMCVEASKMALNKVSVARDTGELVTPVGGLVEPLGANPDSTPTDVFGPGDMQFTDEQVTEFIKLFKGLQNRKECLHRMRNPRSVSGYGVSHRYDKHAKMIVGQYQLEKR